MLSMTVEFKRPEKKNVEAKVTEEDMIYFSLGIDRREFILPSQRKDYRSDMRAVKLVEDIRNGKKFSQKDFSGINLKGADISNGLFHDCNFTGAMFYKTTAKTCDFTDCCFDEAYFESSDFMGCDFTGASFKKVFAKNNNWEKAFFDDEDWKYLSTLEQIVRLIERGKIDIRSLSKNDLLGLDIRRIDFSQIDLEDLDLSMFALDGINLCGTYVDPKQLMSLEGWNSYCLDLRKTKDVTRERLTRKIMLEKEDELRQYINNQKKTIEDIKTKNLKRPSPKKEETEKQHLWGIEKARQEFVKSQESEMAELKKLEVEEEKLFEKYRTEYPEYADIPNITSDSTVEAAELPPEPEQGIQVTPENIQALHSELTTNNQESIFLPAKHLIAKTDNAQSDKNNAVETEKQNQALNESPIKQERPQPILIVSHEQNETTDLKSQQAITSERLFDNQRQIEPQRETQIIEQEMPAKSYASKSPYPYFKEPQPTEPPEPEPTPEPDSDDEETIHDLTNAGFTVEEITEMLRQKGPLKVMGKPQKSRSSKNKTKG